MQSIAAAGAVASPPERVRAPLQTAATFWFVASLAVMILFSLNQASAAIMASYLLFGAVGLVLTRLLDLTAQRLFAIVYGSASIAAAALYLYYVRLYGVPYLLGGSDELHYEGMGLAFARTLGLFDYAGIRGNLVPIWHNSVGYIYTVGVLFKFSLLFGDEPHSMVPRLFNAALLGFIAVGIYRIGARLALQRPVAIAAGLFAGCLPLMMFVSVQSLRDIMVTSLLVAVVAAWTTGEERKVSIPRAVLVTLLVVAVLIDLRKAQAFVAVLIAGVGFLSTDIGRRPIVWVLTLALASVAAAAVYVLLADVISTDLLFFLGQSDYYSAYRVDEVGGGLSSVVFTTPPPLGWLLRTAYALASPFPEMSLELDKLWLNAGTVTHLMFIPFLFAGLAAAARQRVWWTVLGAMVLLFIGMAMFTFQGRHISQYLPFAVLLTALGYERLRPVRTAVFTVTGAICGVLGLVYLLLKL